MKYLVIAALLGQISAVELSATSLRKDNFNGNPDTVSEYDHMHVNKPMSAEEKKAHADKKLLYGDQGYHPDGLYDRDNNASITALAQTKSSHKHHSKRAHKHKDAYDSDVDSTSPYDDAGNINGGNPYMKTTNDESVMKGPGLQEIEQSIEKKLKEAKAEKAADESGVPAEPAQETAISAKEGATEGFTGAIPYAFKDKKLGKDYEAVGAPKPDK